MQKSDIAEIHPLSFMQQTLLLHSLQAKKDQGFLQVKCALKGSIDLPVFKNAVHHVFQQHKALRTTIHWENISKPVQVVHKNVQIPWTDLDWSGRNSAGQESLLSALLKKDRADKLDLTRTPIGRFFLIQLQEDKYLMIWTCHHILVDAWSSSVALGDIMQVYHQLLEGIHPEVTDNPSFFDHLKWAGEQDATAAREFWKMQFEKVGVPSRVQQAGAPHAGVSEHDTANLLLDEKRSQALRQLAKKNSTSLNTIFQGIWALLLASYLKTDQVMYGITSNGRAGTAVASPENIVGMFMNVLPVPVDIAAGRSFSSLIIQIRDLLNEALQFDYLSLRNILDFGDFSQSQVPFDTLFIFQNLPDFTLKGGGVEITEYGSNVTSTYPLTFVVQPQEHISVTIKFDNEIGAAVADEFLRNLDKLLELVIRDDQVVLESLGDTVLFGRGPDSRAKSKDTIEAHDPKFRDQHSRVVPPAGGDITEGRIVAPRNDSEYALYQLWEEILEHHPISIHDSFFDIGGTSLLAIILFDKIGERFNRQFSPTLLMVYPTIEKLAHAIEKNLFEEAGKSVVCLKRGNSEKSLFCLHSVGGQVLFYHPFVQHYAGAYSLYGIQANKQSIHDLKHEGIQGMARYYVQEIRKVQPKGPYAIMSYCNTNSIAMEMAQQLQDSGEKADPLIIIDAMPVGVALEDLTVWEKAFIYLNWMLHGEYGFLMRGVSGKLHAVRQRALKDHFGQQPVRSSSEKRVEEFERFLDRSNAVYRVQPYSGGMYYVQSSELLRQHVLKSVQKTWKKLVAGKMATYTLKGDHINFFRKNNARRFADIIESILHSAE